MSARKAEFAGGAGARIALIASATVLSLFGLVMVYSASSVVALESGAPFKYLIGQAVGVAIGAVGAVILSRMDYRTLYGLSRGVWGVLVLILAFTLVEGLVGGGAKRWVVLGPVRFQPSEFMKIALIMVVAWEAARWMRRRIPLGQFSMNVAILAIIPIGLIMGQPDLGSTAVIVAGVITVLLVAGFPARLMLGAIGAVGAFGVIGIAFSDYRRARVLAFLFPWADAQGSGYQIVQAMLAFGSGGFNGVGLALSRQKYHYLPAAHTDFILAIVGEELGLIGTLSVVFLFVVFIWAAFRIALGSRDPFGKLLAAGIAAMFAVQSALNMAAVTGMFPITGKTLPFLSYGGTSVIATLLMVGLLASVSRYGASAPRGLVKRRGNEVMNHEGGRQRRGNGGPHLPRIERRTTVQRRAR